MRLADQLLPPVSEHRLGTRVHLLDAAVPPRDHDPLDRGIEELLHGLRGLRHRHGVAAEEHVQQPPRGRDEEPADEDRPRYPRIGLSPATAPSSISERTIQRPPATT